LQVELSGVEIAVVLKALLVAVTLLSAGLLLALVMIETASRCPSAVAIVLEPAPTPQRAIAACDRPEGLSRMSLLTRAPPVSPQYLRCCHRDPDRVE